MLPFQVFDWPISGPQCSLLRLKQAEAHKEMRIQGSRAVCRAVSTLHCMHGLPQHGGSAMDRSPSSKKQQPAVGSRASTARPSLHDVVRRKALFEALRASLLLRLAGCTRLPVSPAVRVKQARWQAGCVAAKEVLCYAGSGQYTGRTAHTGKAAQHSGTHPAQRRASPSTLRAQATAGLTSRARPPAQPTPRAQS